METKRDYYDILEINKNAGDAEIKKAYRRLAKKYHPDSNSGNARAEQMFKEVSEAYSVLSDPEKKKLYDRFGLAAFDPGFSEENGFSKSGGFSGDSFRNGTYSKEFYGDGFSDTGFDSLFEHFFQGNNAKHRTFRQKGADRTAEISVTFDEAAFGGDTIVRLQNPETGTLQSLQIHIPAGIDTGQSIRLRGKGMPGIGGGDAGDLLLKVTVREKPGYERCGMDVKTTASIPFTTAVFGGEARVQTLYGDVLCRIREGTQSGTKIKLKGKGIVSMQNPALHGDQYVTVQIQVPKHLTPEARTKLKEFERAC